MPKPQPIRGRMLQYEFPNWQPLMHLAPIHFEGFMWMHEVELEGGLRLQAYKHHETRRYLHLDQDGGAFVYCQGDRYERADPWRELDLALRFGASLGDDPLLLSDRTSGPEMDLRWARSASKHRISRARSRYVIEHCCLRLEEDPPPGSSGNDVRIVFLGDDQEGVALEVIAVAIESEVLRVIHAMKLRERYREGYEEVRKWQR